MIILLFCALWAHAWADLVIPPSLRLGAGSSASQIEGATNVDGKTPSVIETIYSNQNNESSKSYEFWRTDMELIKNLGLQLYRFSIPWTRILPSGRPDCINQAAVKHYSQLIDALLEINVEPVVTILHFDLPQTLQDLGGWHNPDFADWLADYSRVLFYLYGDRVKTWLTVNEPIIMCYFFESSLFEEQADPNLCIKNVLLGHAKAWRVYDREFRDEQEGQVTLANNVMWMEAENDDEEQLADLVRQYYVGVYSHPIFSKDGGWPIDIQNALAETNVPLPELTSEEIELMKGTYDFYAFNYYTAFEVHKARANETVGPWPFAGAPELGAVLDSASPKFKQSVAGGKHPIFYPEGIRAQIKWLNEQYGVRRFMVTENGIANNQSLADREKIVYIQDHIQELVRVIEEDGLDVFGYSAWSLLDSFEFDSGYNLKFGLYSVNFTDPLRTRTPRDSASYYRNLIANARNGRPTKLVTDDQTETNDEDSSSYHPVDEIKNDDEEPSPIFSYGGDKMKNHEDADSSENIVSTNGVENIKNCEYESSEMSSYSVEERKSDEYKESSQNSYSYSRVN